MRKIFTFLFLVFIFLSCKESGVKLAKPSTFVRYFNGGFPDEAKDIIKTFDGGYLLLANSTTNTTLSNTYYKIKLIKTDAYGNQIGEPMLFPQFNALGDTASVVSYYGSSITAIEEDKLGNGTYAITGYQLLSGGKSNLLIIEIEIDAKGEIVKSTPKVFDLQSRGLQMKGVAVTYSSQSNSLLVVGQVQSSITDMFFTQLDGNTLDTLWTKMSGTNNSSDPSIAPTTLINRIYLDQQGLNAYWGGTRYYSSSVPNPNHIIFDKSGFNSNITGYDNYFPTNSQFSVSGNDFIPYQGGYAFIGSHYLSGSNNQYDGVLFTQMNEAFGTPTGMTNLLSLKDSLHLNVASQATTPANSLCGAQDGGLLLLCTASLDAQDSNTDYYLVKVNGFGKQQWTRQYGSQSKDIGAKVLLADDGGFVILGTTAFAGVNSIFLMKTDSDGNIQ